MLSTADIGTRKVIPAIGESARAEVVAIGSRDARSAADAASALGIPRAHGSYADLLTDPEVDAVYNPLPNHLHAEWSIAAARAGKHVLCEKPLARGTDEAQTIVDACESAGVVLMEAFMYRLHASWTSTLDLVLSGRIGRLRSVHSRFSYYNDDAENIRNIEAYGGGALLDIGCYCVSLSRMLFGDEPRVGGASMLRDESSGVDIVTSAALEFESGHAVFSCSTRAEPDQRVQIWGESGRIDIPIPFNIPRDVPTTIRVYSGGRPPTAPAFEEISFATEDAYEVMVTGFARAVLDGAPAPVTTEDSLENMRVIDEIFRAAQPAAG